jgi:hypothetical protein
MQMTVFREVAPCSLIGVGFEVLTAVSTKMTVFWVVAPCSRPDAGGSKDL